MKNFNTIRDLFIGINGLQNQLPLTENKILFQIANFSFRFAEYGTFLKENKVITGTTDARRSCRNKNKISS
jgi:hypothetical protein